MSNGSAGTGVGPGAGGIPTANAKPADQASGAEPAAIRFTDTVSVTLEFFTFIVTVRYWEPESHVALGLTSKVVIARFPGTFTLVQASKEPQYGTPSLHVHAHSEGGGFHETPAMKHW